MGTPILVGDLIQIQPWWTFQEQAGTNVLHYSPVPPVPAVEIEEVVEALSAAWSVECRGIVGTSVVFNGLTGRIYRLNTTFPTVIGEAANAAGTFGTDPLPGQVSGIITKRSADGSRKGRGRVYCPFPPLEACDAAGNPAVAYLAAMNAYATQVLDSQSVVGNAGTIVMKPVIANRPILSGGFKEITSFVVRGRFATQRRRGDYGAPNISPFN